MPGGSTSADRPATHVNMKVQVGTRPRRAGSSVATPTCQEALFSGWAADGIMSAVSDKPPGDDGMTYNPWHCRVVPVFVASSSCWIDGPRTAASRPCGPSTRGARSAACRRCGSTSTPTERSARARAFPSPPYAELRGMTILPTGSTAAGRSTFVRVRLAYRNVRHQCGGRALISASAARRRGGEGERLAGG